MSLPVQLIPGTSTDPGVETFISAKKTIAAARKAGLSAGEYLDATCARQGTTSELIRDMLKIAGLSSQGSDDAICEIGPGFTRFTEVLTVDLVVRNCGCQSPRYTPDGSVDLVHAQTMA